MTFSMDDFKRIRLLNEIDLALDRVDGQLHRYIAEKYGVNPDIPKFHGRNPLTGLPCTIVFNEPAPGRSSVMNWNTLTKCWFYSEDAGLTWERVEKEDLGKYMGKLDCLMDKPEYDGDK